MNTLKWLQKTLSKESVLERAYLVQWDKELQVLIACNGHCAHIYHYNDEDEALDILSKSKYTDIDEHLITDKLHDFLKIEHAQLLSGHISSKHLLGAVKQAKSYLKALPKYERLSYMPMEMVFEQAQLTCRWNLSEVGSGKMIIKNGDIWNRYKPKEVTYFVNSTDSFTFTANSDQLLKVLIGSTTKEYPVISFQLLNTGNMLYLQMGKYEVYTMQVDKE